VSTRKESAARSAKETERPSLARARPGDCLAQQRVRDLQPPIVLDVAPAHPGAKANAAVADGNVAEPGNPAQIDQHARHRQPEGEHRHQALPAGDHDCLGICREQVDRFPQRGGGLVLEGGGFHPLASHGRANSVRTNG
jgi:hypothetical protein